MPFTKQYFHLRDLQKSGKLPQFGSFKYSAHDLYDKGILLSIDQYSPRQFDKIDIVIASNQVGVFTMEVFNNALGITNRMASTDLRMEDLLQAQFDNKASLTIFNGMAKVNLTALLLHINKKCVHDIISSRTELTISRKVLHLIFVLSCYRHSHFRVCSALSTAMYLMQATMYPIPAACSILTTCHAFTTWNRILFCFQKCWTSSGFASPASVHLLPYPGLALASAQVTFAL
jgi:hypothetical protein